MFHLFNSNLIEPSFSVFNAINAVAASVLGIFLSACRYRCRATCSHIYREEKTEEKQAGSVHLGCVRKLKV